MFTVEQIQARYGVGEGTVLGWIRSGELKAVNVGRNATAKKPRWRINPEALEAFERGRTPTPTAAVTPGKKPRRKKTDVIEFIK
jgi:excisionase family DNA binding protein